MNPRSVGASHCGGGQGRAKELAKDGQALSVGAVSHHARLPSCVNVCYSVCLL